MQATVKTRVRATFRTVSRSGVLHYELNRLDGAVTLIGLDTVTRVGDLLSEDVLEALVSFNAPGIATGCFAYSIIASK